MNPFAVPITDATLHGKGIAKATIKLENPKRARRAKAAISSLDT